MQQKLFFTTYMAGDEHILHCPDDPLFEGARGKLSMSGNTVSSVPERLECEVLQ